MGYYLSRQISRETRLTYTRRTGRCFQWVTWLDNPTLLIGHQTGHPDRKR